MSSTFRHSGRSRIGLVLLAVTSIALITIAYRTNSGPFRAVRSVAQDAVGPFQAGFANLTRPIVNFVKGAASYGNLKSEVGRLRAENAKLKEISGQAQQLATENQQLLAEAHLPFLGGIRSVSAEIISGSPSNFESAAVIDRGSSSGIRVGMPVVSGGGLVGQVVVVARSTATVRYVDDPDSKIGARLLTTSTLGVVAGQGQGRDLSMEFVPASTKINLGEEVETSGLQNAEFPPGIPIGTVTNAILARGEPDWEIQIAPYSPPEQLQVVKVMLWYPPPTG